MFLDQKSRTIGALLLVWSLLGGCNDATQAPPPPPAPPVPNAPTLIRSKHPNLKFKGGRRIGIDLAHALGLEVTDLCKELGEYDCIEDAHRIALGGVEPYLLRFNRPLRTLPVTSLQAVERVVLSACVKAAEGGQLTAGVAADSQREGLRPVVESLYRKLLKREVQEAEASALLAFFDEVKASSAEPVREWAVLACFAVGTSVEALFY